MPRYKISMAITQATPKCRFIDSSYRSNWTNLFLSSRNKF